MTSISSVKDDDDVTASQLPLQSIRITHKKLRLSLYKKFGEYLKIKYSNNEKAIDVNEFKEFEDIINLGLIQAKKTLFSKESNLLHNGKKPRKDVWLNLGKIASKMLNCNSYPIIPSNHLSSILNMSLGIVDPRVKRGYRRTILHYCNVDELIIERCSDSRLGELDVTFFISLIPKQYLTTSSTSSFRV